MSSAFRFLIRYTYYKFILGFTDDELLRFAKDLQNELNEFENSDKESNKPFYLFPIESNEIDQKRLINRERRSPLQPSLVLINDGKILEEPNDDILLIPNESKNILILPEQKNEVSFILRSWFL